MTDQLADRDQPTVQTYACIRTGGGEYVIYDQQNPTAWIQSDTTSPVTESL